MYLNNIYVCLLISSLVTQTVKNPPAMQETQVRSPGRETLLEKGNPLQYSCLENSMIRGAWWASPWGGKESDMTERLTYPQVDM